MTLKLLIIGILVFVGSIFVLSKLVGTTNQKNRRTLESLGREFEGETLEKSILMQEAKVDSFGEVFRNVPIIGSLYKKLNLSGYDLGFGPYLLMFFTTLGLLTYAI